ncbi:MAG TPA: ABC-type transport auxiliary lipoprotein family protein [Steroidobacteraceae bacterium]|nr:ABC-type transport auxiliary lipoprotein family protein [Steroidobacteraceae bacterium]
MGGIVALAPLTLLLLAGCSGGLKSNLPQSQVYVLRPTWSAPAASVPAASAPAAGTVQVTLPLAAAGLATDGIVALRSGERLDYYSGARWAGAAPGMLQTLAIDALRGSNKFAMVESDAGPFASEYVLSLELRHFEAEYTGAGPPTVHVALVCTLGKRGNRDVIVSFSAESKLTADADRMQAVVAAFERATGDALSQIAANVSVPVPAKP